MNWRQWPWTKTDCCGSVPGTLIYKVITPGIHGPLQDGKYVELFAGYQLVRLPPQYGEELEGRGAVKTWRH